MFGGSFMGQAAVSWMYQGGIETGVEIYYWRRFYLSAADDRLRHADDKPSIGLILCKTRHRLIVADGTLMLSPAQIIGPDCAEHAETIASVRDPLWPSPGSLSIAASVETRSRSMRRSASAT